MAESVTKTSDLKKIFAKHGISEEPNNLLQRYLNIFRQRHVFDTVRQDEFDRMILELPDEIRGMFVMLPGGALMQEYINDLEEKNGKSRSKTSIINDIDESPEAMIAAATSDVPPPKAAAPVAANVNIAPGEFKMVADENFAKDLAKAFAFYTKTNGDKSNAMVVDIIKAQSQLFSNMASTQTKEISAIITLALKESQQLSTKTIIDAITAFQKENLKIFELRAGNSNKAAAEENIQPEPQPQKSRFTIKNPLFGPITKVFSGPEIDEPVALKPEPEQKVFKTEEQPKSENVSKKNKKNKQKDKDRERQQPKPVSVFEDISLDDISIEPKAHEKSLTDLDSALFDDEGFFNPHRPAEPKVQIPEIKEMKPATPPVVVQTSEFEPLAENLAPRAEEKELKEEKWEWQEVKQQPLEPGMIDLDAVDHGPSLVEDEESLLKNSPGTDFVFDEKQEAKSASEHDEDWEWEYEEDKEPEASAGEQDWEWEYEEEGGEDTAKTVSGEGEDWEWEYEEEEGNDEKPAAASPSGNDEEWEWDYDIVEDDGSETTTNPV